MAACSTPPLGDPSRRRRHCLPRCLLARRPSRRPPTPVVASSYEAWRRASTAYSRNHPGMWSRQTALATLATTPRRSTSPPAVSRPAWQSDSTPARRSAAGCSTRLVTAHPVLASNRSASVTESEENAAWSQSRRPRPTTLATSASPTCCRAGTTSRPRCPHRRSRMAMGPLSTYPPIFRRRHGCAKRGRYASPPVRSSSGSTSR